MTSFLFKDNVTLKKTSKKRGYCAVRILNVCVIVHTGSPKQPARYVMEQNKMG